MDPTQATDDNSMGSKPTQGIFIGYLGLVLLVFALAWMAFGLYAGASHGWQ
jgi:hypothetical protein